MSARRDVWLLAETLENVGDLALLAQLVEAIRSHPRVGRLSVRQWTPPGSVAAAWLAREGVGIVDAKRPDALWPGRRLLLYAGGQAVRSNASPASMLALLLMFLASRLAGGRRAALAIGASDLESAFDRAAWRLAIASLDLVSSRDGGSLARLQALRKSEVVPTEDLVFLPSSLHERLARPGATRHVLIAPCSDASEGRVLDPAAVVRIVGAVAAGAPAPETTILCHDPRLDAAIAALIAVELEERIGRGAAIEREVTIDTAVECYRTCTAVVTNRLHALIFGLLAGKPVFVIGDGNAKVEGFARRFRVPVIPQSPLGERALAEAVQAGLHPAVAEFRSAELERAKAGAARNLELLEPLL